MKKTTIKFNRKLRKAKETARKQVLDEIKKELIKLIPISWQVIETVDAGLECTIHAEMDASKYLALLRKE